MRVPAQQFSFIRGQLSERLTSREDLRAYTQGAAKLDNMVVLPQGTAVRRPGTVVTGCTTTTLQTFRTRLAYVGAPSTVAHLYKTDDIKIPFRVSDDVFYIVTLYKLQAAVTYEVCDLSTGTGTPLPAARVTTTPGEQIPMAVPLEEIDWTTSRDTIILTHEDMPPKRIFRTLDGDGNIVFTLGNLPLSNIPQRTFPNAQADEPVWSDTRGWPRSVTFYQGRTWFGGSKQLPQTVWSSRSGNYFDFDTTDTLSDYGISATIDANALEQIHYVVGGRNLMVFTSSGEYYVPADVITPEAFSFVRVSSIGVLAGCQPIAHKSNFLYVSSSGNTLYRLEYDAETRNYKQSVLNPHTGPVIASPKRIAHFITNQYEATDIILLANQDGTVACLSMDEVNDVNAWSVWRMDKQAFTDVIVNDEVCYLAYVNTTGPSTFPEHDLLRLDWETRLDCAVKFSPTIEANSEVITETVPTDAREEPSEFIAVLFVQNGDDTWRVRGSIADNGELSFNIADMPDKATAQATGYLGLDNPPLIETMPLAPTIEGVSYRQRPKRPVRAYVNYLNTESLVIAYQGREQVAVGRGLGFTAYQPLAPVDGIADVRLLGWSRDARLTLYPAQPNSHMEIQGYTIEAAIASS